MMHRYGLAWMLALLLSAAVAGPVCAQGAAPAGPVFTPAPAMPVRVASVEGIDEYRLPNGLQVLLVPDDSKPTTTVNVTYRVGSRHENYGETGMAHLLEHLVFKGTPTTKNAFAEFTKRGLRANGTTSWDRTNYFASFAANEDNLRWYLSWQADVMVNSFIAKADLDSEMTVVRNEMESGENNPGGVLFRRTLAAMYDWHNYGKPPIGARSDVENVDIARLQAFYRQHYQPDNATLIVTGRFKPEQVLAWVVQSFGVIPRPKRALQPTYTLEAAQDGERRVTVRRVGGTPILYTAYHLPAAAHADAAPAALLAQALGDAPAGRLHKRLVESGLAASVFGTTLAMAEAGVLLVGASLAPGQDVDKVSAEMAAVLDTLAAQPITAAELERARTQWLNAWEQGFTDPERVGVELSSAIAKGDWRLYFLERNRVRQATVADVQRVVQQQLLADNRTVALYRPVAQAAQVARAPAPARVDVAAQLQSFQGDSTAAVAEAFEATPTNLEARTQRFRLTAAPTGQPASGLQVALLPKGTRGGAVQARLTLRFGDEASLQGQGTALGMMGALLGKGAQGLSRQQISDAFDRLRAEVYFNAEAQGLTVTVSTTRAHLPAVIELLGRVLRQPVFEADALEEMRRQGLAGIEQQRKEPEALVANALARHGNPYPKGDPRYAESFAEMEAALKAVQLADVQRVYRRFVGAQVGEFAAVGDLDAAAVTAALQQAFAGWQPAAADAPAYRRLPQPLVQAPPLRVVLPAPDKQNATLLVQLPLPMNDEHRDYPAFMLANFMFGGGGDSRLWRRIREQEGLSYDVRSGVDWNTVDLHSGWSSSAIFAPQNQAKVEAAWREELQRSLQQGFTLAELESARLGLLNLRRLSRAQDGVVVAQLASNLHLGRSFKVSMQVDEALAKLTLEQVNAAWRTHIRPDQLAMAWAGDFKAP
jgi:zinc protease